MDWQRIKEKVTEEVLRQLQGDASATPEKVQQMVISAVLDRPDRVTSVPEAPVPGAPVCLTGGLPACEVGPDFKTDLLAVVAGPVDEKVSGALKSLAQAHKVTVVAHSAASQLADMQACGQVVCDGNEATARRLVEGAGLVVVPALSLSVAAKAGSLIGDCLPSAVLVQVALAGKRAVVARDGMGAPENAPWSVRSKAAEVSSALRMLGFVVTDLSNLTSEVKKAQASGKTGGFLPAYQPHPAVLASRAARAEANARSLTDLPGAAPTPPVADFDRDLARKIDHTLLKPEATAEQITKLCREAVEYSFWSVCVNPTWVPLCAKLLAGSKVKVCTVIGFPLGATSSESKALETADVIKKGAHEVDMVLNVGALKSGQHDLVFKDIKAVVEAARGKALTKVILETGLLSDEEKVKACELSKQAGADFVKTSTGFGPGGATPEDIALMRKTVGPAIGVKASGGIRDYETALAVVNAGATRIGASASVNIVKRVRAQSAGTKEKY